MRASSPAAATMVLTNLFIPCLLQAVTGQQCADFLGRSGTPSSLLTARRVLRQPATGLTSSETTDGVSGFPATRRPELIEGRATTGNERGSAQTGRLFYTTVTSARSARPGSCRCARRAVRAPRLP